MVRDVTELVHAQAQDSLSHAQHLHRLQQSTDERRPDKDRTRTGVHAGQAGLTEAEIDDLSGSEARAMLKVSTSTSSADLICPADLR
jgi:hypothetical protein